MSFNITHQHGEIKKVTLANGTIVYRPEHIFIKEWGTLHKCADYSDHFVFENPDMRKGTPGLLCTCGSVAVIVPASPDGIVVCLFDLENGLNGYHTTSLYSSRDIDKVAGKTLDMGKIRKELI